MRKSSKARLFSTCLTGAILAAASPAWGQAGDASTWKPRAEVDAQVGKDIGVSTSLFAPIAQNDSSLVYVDGRIGYDQRFDRNGSATVGARFRVGEDVAIGVNAGADFYRSDIGSRDQAAVSMGLEGFTSVFDVRVNYRLPLSKIQTIGYIDPAASSSAALVLENNRLIERHSGFRLEAIPLQGFNGEAGVRLPVGGNASIRGSVGGFDYWDRDADKNYRGIRGGLEMDIEDRDSGARFTFGGTIEHDNRFGTDARATVRLSVPFGGRSGDRGAVPTGLDRQMGDRVRRDYVARSGSRYRDLTSSRFAVDARTGNEFGGFYYASGTGVAGAAGTLATPTTINDAVTRAGANGVVVALGSGGTITTQGVTLATNQYLLGGAGAVDVRLLDGSTAQFALGGTNGVIVGTNAAGATVTLGQGSVVRDVTIRGAGTGIAANGVGGFALDRVIVENTGGAGISLTNTLGSVALTGLTVRGGAGAGVLVNGGSSVSLANSTISGGAGAVDINDGGANLAVSLSGLTLSATGGNVLDIDGSGAGTVTVTGLSGITIRGGTGETGGLSVRSATFDANTVTAGIQTVNAGRMEVGTTAARVNGQGVFLTDVTGNLSFTDLDIANSGATGLRVVNSKVNSFTLATLDGTIDTVGGTAADLDPLVIDLNFAGISSVGAAGAGVILDTVQGGGTGGNALTIGTLTISNSGGDGLVILNSSGLVRVNGGAITNSGGSSVRIGTQGVAGSGGSTNLAFGASITDPTGTAAIVAIFNTSGTFNFTGPISGSGPILVQDTLAGSAISFGAITLTGTAGDAITLNNLAGSINFAGLVTIANPGANGIVIGNVPGGVTFGNVDITGLGNFTGLDVTGTHGNVLFTTLDIAGAGAGKGIDVTGSTNAGNVIVLNGSTIQGVNIGVDLTQANMTGQFRFGDGNPVPLNSTIAANIPIVIAQMNASNGSYNFADANLVGDTSNLTGAGFTAYYARVGATGAGTRSDPGSLAGADASNAQYIVLLNDPTGGQDVFDAASAGGSFDLAVGQSLVSFLNGDFFAVSGAGLPANLTVSGVAPSGITNVYAGSGSAVLTTTTAGSATVNLSSNSRIDGLVIRNAGNDVGVEGVGVSGVTITNSDIGGSAGAIAISDGGAAASVTLTHLDLSSSAGATLSLSGAGAGTLTVSASDVDIAATGTSAALSITDVSSGGIGFGAVSTGTSATTAVSVQNLSGAGLAFGSIAVGGTVAGEGVAIGGSSSAVTAGSISVGGSDGDGVLLANNSGAISIGSVNATISGTNGNGLFAWGGGNIAVGTLALTGGDVGLAIEDFSGTIAIGSGSISGAEYGVSIENIAAGGSVSIGTLAVSGSIFDGIALESVDGSVAFTGTTSISGVGRNGILIGGGSDGTITFGDVDITGLGANTTGVYARDASGTISFNTLDITGSSTTGTRGIDLTGATFATNFTTTESSSITGVGIGVDLTNAAITGNFRYGDGSNTDADGAASSINAVTPIVITGINVGAGSYNFLDVALTGDTSTLTSSATLYFVKAGATGVGTIADPGSLAGAEASMADTIILLNDPTGGQDVIDAAGAGGSFDLAAGRTLLSFLNGDTLMLPGGAPANLLLFGIPSGQINNPFAGSGAPVLTTTIAGANTVNLGGSNLLDGLIIGSGVNGIGVSGSGVTNITLRNSTISGPAGAIAIDDGGLNASVALSNLTLSSTNGVVALLDGTGGGMLAVTSLNNIIVQGGNGETAGFYADGVLFDADLATAGAQTVTGSLTLGTAAARVNGTGFVVDASDGSLDLTSLTVFNANDAGVVLSGNLALTAMVRTGSIDTAGGNALVAADAALALDFASITAVGGSVATVNGTAADPARPVLHVASLNLTDGGLILGGSGDYVIDHGSITDNAFVATLLTGAVNLDYAGDITTGVGALATIATFSHTGTASFHDGTIDVTDGDGFQFLDADGTYSFTGTTTIHGGDAGINVANGSSGTFFFGAGTSVTDGAIANFVLQNSDANVTYLGSLTQGLNTDNFVVSGQTGGVVDFSQATVSASAGSGLLFLGADGTSMLGDVQLSGGAGIEITGSGAISFDNVDITGVGANQTAVDLTGALGNVTFLTLDIAGASTVGSKGIDLTGNTGTGDIVVSSSSTITGVGVGVDLTNASRPGLFQYGDGSLPANSTINATAPIAITGLNSGIGTYNFIDVNLVGDTSGLATSATVYYVLAGATGAGTRNDPGSLAAAEAAAADFIILLNDPAGGQDVLDALGTNGDDSFLLDLNQVLRAFDATDTIVLPGGAPANVMLTGVASGSVTNPYAGSGAPILTTTGTAATLILANNNVVDSVIVQGVSGQAAVQGTGVSGVTLSNSTISGAGIALRLTDGGAAATATLTNLDLSASGGSAAVDFSGAGAGTLTVTGSGLNVSHSGSGSLLTIADILVGGGNLSFGTVASTASGAGIDLGTVAGFGTLSFGSITVAGASGSGVALHNSSAIVNLGDVTVSGAAGAGIQLTSNSGATTIGTIDISSSTTGIAASGLTSTLTVGDGTIDGATTAGILLGAGNTVLLSFGNIDITALQTGARGVDARLTGGSNVFFETLDISGASATGTRGIDLTGNTGSGNFTVNESSSITGVGIGVDLTNASRTSGFRYGDGSNIDADLAASTINATTPIVIAGLNGVTGTYDFRDVTLVGDTSTLEVSAFFVRAGATGVGSRSDPGSLAAADASTASFIVLLDTQAGAGSFDTISGTLTLADNQSLLSFRDTDTFTVGGGAPANVFVFNITTGTITNPNSGSGAPLLTSTDANGTVTLAGTSVIDGVVISNTGTGAGVFANGTAGTATIRNSTISGGGAAVDIRSGALVRAVNLQNLTLANAGNQAGALLNLNGTGGTLTVTGMSNLTIGTAGGETAGLVFNTVTFDSDLGAAGIQAVNAGALIIGTSGARVEGDGLSLTNVSGALTFADIDIANNNGTGLLVANSKVNNFLLTTLDGSVDTTNGTAIDLDPLTVNITLAGVTANSGVNGIVLDQVEGDFVVTGAVNVTGVNGTGILIRNNTAQTDPLTARFDGTVSINALNTGMFFDNNAGATITFAGGGSGVDIVTSIGAGVIAQAGGEVTFAGSGNSIQTTTGQIARLMGITAGAGGINFSSMASSGTIAGASAILLNNLDGGGFSGGTVTIAGTSGASSHGIEISGGSASAMSFGTTTISGTGGDGVLISGPGHGAITFSSVAIDNTGDAGVSLDFSDGPVTISGGAIGSLNDPTGTGVNINGGSGAITIDAGISKTTAGRAVVVSNRTGGSVGFGGTLSSSGASNGLLLDSNSGGTITFSNAAKTINTPGSTGVLLSNNAGATIDFTNGGLAITSGVSAFVASGGGVLNVSGGGNTISSTGTSILELNGMTVGASGINFASVSSASAAVGVALTNIVGGGGVIALGTVNLQGMLTRGIDVTGTLGAALTITDLDIGLANASAVAVDLNGATLSAAITANDFDVTNSAAAGTTIAIDLRGTTGGQVIRLGDAAVGGESSSISGVGTGVWLNAATDATFTYGDGEAATDGTSTISAGTGINAAAAPVAGNYDFRDVIFGASPGLGFGVGRTWFVDSNGATGGGNGSGADGANPMTLGAAELALAATDVIVLINNGSAISTAGSNGNDTLNLIADTQVRGFGQGPLALTLSVPARIELSSNTINIADPTGNGAATLTSGAGANVITLGASGNRISGFILDGTGGALRGIVDGAGATGTVINFMTIQNFAAVGGYGVEITPSTNTTIDNATFTGNTNDVFLNAAGSTITNVTATGATGTSITLDNTTGTTTLTNVNISGAATGMSFTNGGGPINAVNVDISGAATSALTVSGGTASFNFDAASSIVQAAGGLTLNITGNHTIGTFAFAGLINATSGNGMQFSNADGTYNFTGTTTLNGGNAGIDIYNDATGTFAFGSATALTHNNAGNAFVLLSSANVTFDGAITDNDGLAIEIDGHDAGTATFNGAISSSIANASTVISVVNSNGGAINFNGQVMIASTGTAVSLSGNQGATITFNASGTGLDITGTTSTAMIVTGGGTVNVQGANNSITTTSGTLLSITDTGGTATAVDLSFASASNTSGANGIFVQRIGAGTITGTVNIGGGAITATTRGVSLNGDALNFTYGGTLTTSGAASRSFEATSRTGGTATLSGNLSDTSLGISIANNTGGTVNFTGQTISLNTGANTAVTLSNNAGATVNFASAGGGNGLDIVTAAGAGISATGGGTLSISGAGNSIQTATGQILNFTGVSAGASGVTFASLQSTGTVAGIAINLNNFDSVGGGAFSGGTTSVAATSGGNDGIFIGNGSAANVSFGATTIGTGTISGDGIEVNGSGNGAVTFASVDIDNTTAHGVSVVGAAGATGAVAINGGTIGAGGAGSITGDGVNITGGGGSVTVAASIAKTNAGNVVEVSNHAAGAVTFSNNISATGGAANGILLSNNSGGTITFSGATKTLNTGGNNAIQFDNTAGTGAAVSFTGGNLDIDTTSGRGITGTSTTAGAGSLTITGTNNSITSAGGIALNLVNTNIGAGGLNFLSISANGGTRGIVLDTTGGAGGLTITGTGTTDGSGGTIQNITQRGIELLDTALVSIANLNLTNASTTGQAAGQDLDLTTANGAIYMSGVATAVFNNINITGTIADNGITGINVSNFQLNNSVITGAGDGAHESGIEFNNLSGTSSLTNTEIALSETNSLDIVNTDVNLNLTLNNVTFRDTQSSGIGEGGLQFRSFSNAAGTPTTNIDIVDSDFLRIRTQAVQIIGEDDSVVSVDITNSVIDSQTGIGAGIDISGNDTSTVRFNIIGNPTIRSSGGAAINIVAFLNANVMGRINNNADIEVYSQLSSGTGASGSGIRLLAQENSHMTVSAANNTLTQGAFNNNSAVDVIAREGSARLDFTFTGNVIDSTDVNTSADIRLQSGASSDPITETNQIYANIANNNLTATAATNFLLLRVSEFDNNDDPRIFLQGFVEGGSGIEDDAVATWNANGNTPNNATASNIAVSLTGTATGPSAGTAQTPTNPLP